MDRRSDYPPQTHNIYSLRTPCIARQTFCQIVISVIRFSFLKSKLLLQYKNMVPKQCCLQILRNAKISKRSIMLWSDIPSRLTCRCAGATLWLTLVFFPNWRKVFFSFEVEIDRFYFTAYNIPFMRFSSNKHHDLLIIHTLEYHNLQSCIAHFICPLNKLYA